MRTAMLGIWAVTLTVGCGGTNSNADGGGDATAGAHIFVTSADFDGGFRGLQPPPTDGAVLADHQCQTAADGAGLTGTFHAWLSRYGDVNLPVRSAPERVTGQGPWYLTGSNELVFLNRSALANTPRVPINRNELGVVVTSGPVWTGTSIGGTAGFSDCNGWTSGNSANDATVGRLEVTTSAWTDTGTPQHCNVRAHLYCLEM